MRMAYLGGVVLACSQQQQRIDGLQLGQHGIHAVIVALHEKEAAQVDLLGPNTQGMVCMQRSKQGLRTHASILTQPLLHSSSHLGGEEAADLEVVRHVCREQ